MGKVSEKTEKNDIIYCFEPMCIKSFPSVEKMSQHLDFEKHDFGQSKALTMEKIKNNWVNQFTLDSDTRSLPSSATGLNTADPSDTLQLQLGWAIPKRYNRRLSEEQKSFLNNIFIEGEKKGCKATAENALAKMRMQFMPKDYLPVSIIRSYFSRRAKKVCSGEINILESENKLEEDDEGMV